MRESEEEDTTGLTESTLLVPPNPETAPKDRFYVVYGIFYLLGIGSLLPWNFFTNAKPYFLYKFRNTSLALNESYDDPENLTELGVMFEAYLAVAAMVPNVLFMFLNTAATKLISVKVRMIFAACVMIVMFALTLVLVKIDTDTWQTQFFAVTLVTIVIMNAGSAVLQGGMFGLSSMFPKQYTQSVMGGMGMGGTMAALANVLAMSIATNALDNGFGYFMVAEVFIILALIGFIVLPNLKYVRFHTEAAARSRAASSCVNTSIEDSGKVEVKAPASSQVPLWEVFKHIYPYGLSVWFVFFITLSCYPAINSAIVSESPKGTKWADTFFMPVTCFVFFNVGDLSGRTLAGFVQWPREKSPLLYIFCALRVIFVPLFLLCNIQPRHYIPVLLRSDIYPSVIMWLFSLSNGYLGTLCMMYGPSSAPLEHIETAGSMMSFFLALGLGSGSLFAFVLLKIV